jgi:lipoprotein LpqH
LQTAALGIRCPRRARTRVGSADRRGKESDTSDIKEALVKHGITIGIASAAMVVAALAGCSSNKSNPGATSSPSSPTSGAPAAAGPQVTIDGQNQNITGQVTCTAAGDNTNIGIGDASNGVGAVVSNANPPIVHSVGLGNVNGVALGFSDGAPGQGANAGAAQNGKSYAIKGTATGVDMTNPQQPQQVKKSFEIDVTCP